MSMIAECIGGGPLDGEKRIVAGGKLVIDVQMYDPIDPEMMKAASAVTEQRWVHVYALDNIGAGMLYRYKGIEPR